MNEVTQAVETSSPQLEWTRKDYGTTRLMLPGDQGPRWSQCKRRVTRDLDTGRIPEDRDVSEVIVYERRRDFKHGARNTSTTFTCSAVGDTQPHKWKCEQCDHLGWLKKPGLCQACESVGTVKPTSRNDILVIHRQEDGTAYAWDDVSGTELASEVTLKPIMEEMEQFKKHGV